MSSDTFRVYALPGPSCDTRPAELIALWTAAGWGSADMYTDGDCARALAGTALVVAARDAAGLLLGCARVLSDGVYHTVLADLVVHPDHRRRGIGRAMVELVKAHCGSTGIFLDAVPEACDFFTACGFRRRDLTAMAARFVPEH